VTEITTSDDVSRLAIRATCYARSRFAIHHRGRTTEARQSAADEWPNRGPPPMLFT